MNTIYQSSFDEGFLPQEGEQLLRVPAGWTLAWTPGEKPGPVRPECQPEVRSQGDRGIRTGEHGCKLAHAYAFFDGALYRIFGTAPGRLIRAQVWTTAESGGGLACRIGLDPAGGIDFADPGVVWSDWYGTDNPLFQPYRFQQVAADAEAQSSVVTVFLHARARDAVQVNAGFFDDVAVLSDESQPPPTPHGIGPYVDAIDAALQQARADVDALRQYITEQSRTCLLVD